MSVNTYPPATGSGYNTVEDEGVALTQRTTINFTGAGVTASDVAGETEVNIPGGAGSGLTLGQALAGINNIASIPV